MDLRPQFLPPNFDEVWFARLVELAARLDGADSGVWDDDLAEFNRLAGTTIPFDDFQEIYEQQSHRDWVRRILFQKTLLPCADISLEEMIEIVTRAMSIDENADWDFYLELFVVNCKHPLGVNLIFGPTTSVPEFPQDREPTAEEIACLAVGYVAK
ncbi:hypothetical protein [Zavarzinella formosa]|uniref:hypothetical protein n=1 Tax=Zavarzinella formosa TaxID=360055 RepID=UPI000305B8D2|nr:hypothetical protein [Zavarzinella formosa]